MNIANVAIKPLFFLCLSHFSFRQYLPGLPSFLLPLCREISIFWYLRLLVSGQFLSAKWSSSRFLSCWTTRQRALLPASTIYIYSQGKINDKSLMQFRRFSINHLSITFRYFPSIQRENLKYFLSKLELSNT